MRTRADLIVEVLETLGVLSAGQTPEVEDVDTIERKLDSVFEELSAREVYTVADFEEVEDDAFAALADCVAAYCAGPFRVVQIRGQDIETAKQLAERRLRRLGASASRGTILQTTYY